VGFHSHFGCETVVLASVFLFSLVAKNVLSVLSHREFSGLPHFWLVSQTMVWGPIKAEGSDIPQS
jgi:hypothetical protein